LLDDVRNECGELVANHDELQHACLGWTFEWIRASSLLSRMDKQRASPQCEFWGDRRSYGTS